VKAEEVIVRPDPGGALEILERHGDELFALLSRLTLRTQVAEDLLQELFLRLLDADGFFRAGNRKAYAFRTAINLALDWRRKRRPVETLKYEPADGTRPVLDRLIEDEELEEVLDALPALSELGREIVIRKYLQQETYEQLAVDLGKSEHQIRALCFKALEFLRRLLTRQTNKAAEHE
jgi:RNA polymerase sigma-70 factor (ECF subfamily)